MALLSYKLRSSPSIEKNTFYNKKKVALVTIDAQVLV